MAFWVYVNWTAEHKAVIHHGACRFCNEGKGLHKTLLGEKNGKWLGPFVTRESAEIAAIQTDKPVRPCKFCVNE